MDFRVLGPISVRSAGVYRPVAAGRHRKILAALLLETNKPVSTDRLVDVIWGARPPTTARQQTQNCVGSLRARLEHAGHRVQLTCRAANYTLELGEDRVDGLVFRQLSRRADERAGAGDLDGAARDLEQALGLWHGSALQDVDSRTLDADATRLDEIRLAAVGKLVDIRFAQGRHGETLADLFTWIRLYPYHEGLHCALAEGLHRAGRTAEASAVLRTLRQQLGAELGIAPGRSVYDMEQRLLAGNGAGACESLCHGEALQSIRLALNELTTLVNRLTVQSAV